MIGFALVGAFYVLRGHWGHAFGALPYLLLLVCSLMHFLLHRVLLHRGHGHRHGGGPP